MLKAGPPWPADLASAAGELPEYITAKAVDVMLKWVPAKRNAAEVSGFLHRARVDLELVVDGNVIDLNRIALPRGTPVVDKRF